MNRTTLVAAGLAVLVIATGAVVAQPGNAPVEVPTEKPDDAGTAGDHAMNETAQNETTDHANATDAHADNGDQGPPVEMPTPVPDRVAQIHEVVQKFIDGKMDGSLGQSLQDVLGNEQHGEAASSAQQDG